MSEAITDEDRRMINYFIRVKGDITRWCDWDEKQDAYPDLIASIERLSSEELTLYAILFRIESDITT